MKYSIDINGIHCSGCINLIKFCIEEANFSNVQVSQENNKAEFETDKNINEVDNILIDIFKKDLENYKYTNLTVKN